MPTAYVIVPGVLHVPLHYAQLVAALQARGNAASAVQYATNGPAADAANLEDDIVAVRAAIEDQVRQGRDVILVAHSYGGFPASRAVSGLEKDESRGRAVGVVRVWFVAASIIPEGTSQMELLSGQVPWWMEEEGNYLKARPDHAHVLFHDLPPADAAHYFAALQPQRKEGPGTVRDGACWSLQVRKTFLVTLDDQCYPAEYQRAGLELVRGLAPATWEVREIAGGHSPFLSRVGELVELLAEGA